MGLNFHLQFKLKNCRILCHKMILLLFSLKKDINTIYEYVIKNEKNVWSKCLFAVGIGFVIVCVTWVVTLWFVCEYIKLLVLFYFWWKRLISPSHASFIFLSKVNTFQFLMLYELPWIYQTESMKSWVK